MAMLRWLFLVISVMEVLSLPMPFGVERDCNINNFKLQEDFSLERYMGTWFVIGHIQKTDYPYQKRSHYGLREDGTISMRTERIIRPSDCNPWEFEATGTLNDDDVDPAKLYLYPPMPGYLPDDYWVVSTDYTSYSLVYSCGRLRSNGSCTQHGQRAWLIARSPQPLPMETHSYILEKLWEICVNPERLRDLPAECEVPLTQDVSPKMPESTDCLKGQKGNCSKVGEQTDAQEVGDDSVGARKYNPCEIATFQLQSNFTVEKFLGEWYEISHSRAPGSTLRLPDMRSLIFSPAAEDSEADMDLLMKDIKLGGQCANMDTPGLGWVSENHPAKFIVHFPIPEKYGVSGPVEYWILGTDYSNYAVTYSCHEVNEDGTCDKQREALWVLSRSPSLPSSVQTQVDLAIQGVCMDHLRLLDNQDVCYTTDIQEETNETEVVVEGKAAVREGCDPATAKYGCCLLNNRPATGPNYQGCPRMRPPVAGQSLEMRPVSDIVRPAPVALAQVAPAALKVKEAECDEKIICKIYCDYGFKKNEDGCDICECAKAPTDIDTVTEPPLREAAGKTKLVSCLHQIPSKLGSPLLDCEQDGTFARVQCHDGDCWCADPAMGYEIAGTRANHDKKPDCDQPAKASKWNKRVSKMRSDCWEQRLEAETTQDLSDGSGSYYLPVCDKQGLYEQVQCYMESDMCWCVDVWTGVQVEGSMMQGRPQCSP